MMLRKGFWSAWTLEMLPELLCFQLTGIISGCGMAGLCLIMDFFNASQRTKAIKCINGEEDSRTFPTAITLQVIELYDLSFSRVEHLTFVMQLLKKSPNLCKLLERPYSCDAWIIAASRLLEDPNNCIINQDLKMLNTVTIEQFSGSTVEMLVVKMLLSKSLALERIGIRKSVDINTSMFVKIQRELLRFPRASPNAQIVCMYSKFSKMKLNWFSLDATYIQTRSVSNGYGGS